MTVQSTMNATSVLNLHDVTLLLIEAGADLNFQFSKQDNNTLLHLAIIDDNIAYIKLLLDFNPSLNARNNNGETAKDLALRLGNTKVIQLLDDYKNKTFESIDEKFVCEFHESFSLKSIEDQKGNRNFRVLRIKECKNVTALFDKIQKDAFRKALSKTSHLFVMVIETNEKLIDDLKVPNSIFNDKRPFVVQVMEGSQKSTIYYKELHSSELVKINDLTEISRHEFLRKFNTVEGCNFSTLVQGINSMAQGNFSNVLIDMKLIKGNYINEIATIAAKLNILCLLMLKLFKTDLGVEISSLYETFDYQAKQTLITLLDLPFSANEGKSENEILIAIIKRNDVSLLQIILNNGFEVGNKEEPLKKALDLKFYGCAKALIEADSCFPKRFDLKKIVKREPDAIKLQDVLNTRIDFHNEIRSGNIEGVKTFIDNNLRLKHGYDASNTSALRVALEAKKWEIYTMLQSRGFSAGVDKKFEKKLYDLDIEHKESIREINKKFFKTSQNSHLFHVLTKTRLSFNFGNSEEFFEIIRSMYEKLNEMPTVKPILKLLEKWEVFQVIIDFAKRFVADMDPTVPTHTQGVTYPNGYIYVAAANHTEERDNIIGTLAHELTHFAMTLVYGNNKKPYRFNDEARKTEFKEITRNIKNYWLSHNEETSWIISAVFKNYPEDQWHAELIVRVPHLSAVYAIDELLNIEKNYCGELFKFYNSKTLIDITDKIDFLQPEAEIEELNKIIGQINKIDNVLYQYTSNEETITKHQNLITILDKFQFRIITSNIPQLTLTMIYEMLHRKYVERLLRKVIFATLESLSDEYLSERIRNLCNSKVNPLLIVKLDDINFIKDKLLSDFQSFSPNRKLLMITASESFDLKSEEILSRFSLEHLKISHTWSDLDKFSQDELLLRRVTFHGSSVELQQVLPSKVINDYPLQILMMDKLTIDNITQKEIFTFKQGVYIKRKFIVQQVERNRNIGFGPDETIEVEMDQDKLIEDAKAKRIVIISDAAGMGKTTTLKEIAKVLKEKNPTCWISFIDLKQHIDKFEIIAKSTQSVKNFTEFVLMCIEKDFDKKVFLSLYQAGKVFLLLDGFDEISPLFKDLIIQAVASFNYSSSGNQLWITTRAHLKTDLERGLHKHGCSLVPLSRNDQIDIVLDYWKSKETSSSVQLNLRELASNLIEKISLKFSESGSNLMIIPLQIRIIAEIYIGRAEEVQELETLSFYSIYETLMRKNIRIWMREKGESSLNDREEMHMNSLTPVMKVHQQIALNYRFGSNFADLQIERKEWDREMISRVGIIHYDITEKTHFIHETFAEFFVAHFIINNLKLTQLNVEVEMMTKLLESVLKGQKHQMIRTFLDTALETQNNQDACTKMISSAPLNISIEEIKCFDIFHQTVEEQLESLFRLIFACVESFSDEKLIKDIIKFKTESQRNIFMLACSNNQTENMLKIVWDKTKRILDVNERQEAITEKSFYDQNILRDVLQNNEKALNVMMSILREVFIKTEELKKYLYESETQVGSNVLCLAASHCSRSFFDIFWTFLLEVFDEAEVKALFLRTQIDGKTVLHHAVTYNSKNVIEALFLIVKKLFELDEQKQFIQRSDTHKKNILHYASRNDKNSDIFLTLLNIYKELSMENAFKLMLQDGVTTGFSVLHYAMTESNSRKLQEIVSILQVVFTHEELKLYLNQKFELRGWNLLIMSLHQLSTENFEFFWTFLQEVFDSIEYKALLLEVDKDGMNALHHALQFNDQHVIMNVFRVIEKYLNSDEQRTYVLQCDKYRKNILDHAAENRGRNDILTTLWHNLKKLSMDDAFKLLLKHKKNNENNFLRYLMIERNPNMLDELTLILREVFNNEELKSFLKDINLEGEANILCLMTSSLMETSFDMFWILLRNVFNLVELKSLVLETDRNGKNALHHALQSNMLSLIEKVKGLLNHEEMKAYVQQRDNTGQNILHHVAKNFYKKDILPSLWSSFKGLSMENDFKSMLQDTKYHGANVLHSVLIEDNRMMLKEFLLVLPKIFTHEELKLFMDVKENEHGRNILHLAAVNSDKKDFDRIWLFTQDVFDLIELQTIIVDTDENGMNILHLASRYNDEQVVRILFKIISTLLNLVEQNDFVRKRSKNDNNILHLAARNHKKTAPMRFGRSYPTVLRFQTMDSSSKKIFTTIWDCMKEFSMEGLFKLMLQQQNSSGQNVFKTLIIEKNYKAIQELKTISKEVYSDTEQEGFWSDIEMYN